MLLQVVLGAQEVEEVEPQLHPRVEQVEQVEQLMVQTALLGQERLVAQEEQTLEAAVAVVQALPLALVPLAALELLSFVT
jgi:hypothetical protein